MTGVCTRSDAVSGSDIRTEMNSNTHEARADQVDHHTPYAHWCGLCSHWVVDCTHVVDPLPMKRVAVEDACIESLAYHRQTGRLEVSLKLDAVQQFWPVSRALFRELWKARPMNSVLYQKIFRKRGMHFGQVRSEGKILASMLRGMDLLDFANEITRESKTA
jgi:hypothetical protein